MTVHTLSTASSICKCITIPSTASSIKYNGSLNILCLHLFFTHRWICRSVISLMDDGYILPPALKLCRSSSSIEALEDVSIMSSFNCLPFWYTCFSYSSRKPLRPIECLVGILWSLNASTKLLLSLLLSLTWKAKSSCRDLDIEM